MSKTIPALDDAIISWIETQPVFFVAAAPDGPGGHVKMSPKSHDTFRVLDPTRVAYLDLTRSGAETTAHLPQNGPITVIFPGFAGPPRIVRVHGRGTVPAQQRRLLVAPALVRGHARRSRNHRDRDRTVVDVMWILRAIS